MDNNLGSKIKSSKNMAGCQKMLLVLKIKDCSVWEDGIKSLFRLVVNDL